MSKKTKWEKEFDEEFTENGSGRAWAEKHIYRDGGEIHIKRVKSFISKQLAKEKMELVEEIKNEMTEWPATWGDVQNYMGIRECLLTYLEALKLEIQEEVV